MLCHATDPLPGGLEIAGCPRAELLVGSDSPHGDFVARLVEIAPDGAVGALCEGIVRDPLASSADAARPQRIEIELAPLWHRVRPGFRLRLEITSSSWPRIDRHPNVAIPPARAGDADGVPSRQRLWHDRLHPSRLVLPVLREA